MQHNVKCKINKIFLFVLIIITGILTCSTEVKKITASVVEIKDTTFQLTEEEQAYIKLLKESKIRFGVTDKLEYHINENGEETGTAVPVINFIRYELDKNVEVISGTWNEIYEKSLQGEIDIMNNVYIGDNIEKNFYLGTSVYDTSIVAISNKINNKGKNGNFDNLSVGMVKNTAVEYYAMPYLYSSSEIKYYESTDSLVKALKQDKIDTAIMEGVFNELLYDDSQLMVSYAFPQLYISNTIGTCKDEYKPFIDIFNRFVDGTDEGDFMREQIGVERERYSIENFYYAEKKIINKIIEKFGVVKYYPGSGENLPMSYIENGSTKGVIKDLFDYFEEMSGIEFEEVKDIGELDDAMEKLSLNEIQFTADIVKNQSNKEYFGYSEPIYENRFIIITGVDNEEINNQNINEHYWGILSGHEALFKNSLFEEHIITFQTEKELLKAVSNNDISGAIVKEGLFDYYNMVLGEKKYKSITDISVPYTEQIAYNKDNKELNRLIEKMLHMYKLTYPDYEDKWEDITNNYRSIIVEYYLKEAKFRNRVFLAGTIISFLAVAAAVFIVLSTRKIRNLNMKLKVLVNSNKKVDIIEVNLNTECIKSSSNFTMFGIAETLRKKDSKVRFYSLVQLSKQTGYDFINHYKNIKQHGKKIFEEEYIIEVKGKKICIREIGNVSKQYIVSTLFDVTDKEVEKGILKKKAEYDCLTGIYNRTAYARRISDIIEEYPEKLGAFAFIDLNKFKNINDEYGHKAGDDLLVSFAESLETLVRDENTVVFRIAGDEFGAFRGNLKNDEDIKKFADELAGLTLETTIDNEKVTGTYSCGISIYNRDGIDIMTLSECSDIAMYNCKKNNTIVEIYDESMREN